MVLDRSPEMEALVAWWDERLSPNTPVSGASVAAQAGMEASRIHTVMHNNKGVPSLVIVVRLTRALRRRLDECNHPLAPSTSVPKALAIAGIITQEDLDDEHPGNWLKLDGLPANAQAALMAFYRFLRAEAGLGDGA